MINDKYYGLAAPGAGKQKDTLNTKLFSAYMDVDIYPGTLNITTLDPFPFEAVCPILISNYCLWPCRISTRRMLINEEVGFFGWILRSKTSTLPDNFVEIISPIRLRSALKAENQSSFSVEIALQLDNEE